MKYDMKFWLQVLGLPAVIALAIVFMMLQIIRFGGMV